MVASAISTALSGLLTAATRIAVSSKNIANFNSTSQISNGQTINSPYQPQRVLQSTQANTGSVLATVVPSQDEPVPVYDPSNPDANEDGIVFLPNVNLDRELVDIARAATEYKANLATIRREKDIQDSLLDILE